MPGKIKRALQISVLLFAILLAVIGFGLVPVNLFFAKGAIGELLEDHIGLKLDIQGPVRIRFGFSPEFTASGLSLHAPESRIPPLVIIEKLSLKPRLLDFLQGDFFLRDIQVERAEVNYCHSIWSKPKDGPGSSITRDALPPVSVDEFSFLTIKLSCAEKEEVLAYIPEYLDLMGSAPLNHPIEIQVVGHGKHGESRLTASSGNIAMLLENPPDFPFQVDLELVDSEVSFTGTIASPLSDREIAASGNILSGLMEKNTGCRSASVRVAAGGFSSRPHFEVEADLQQIDLQRMLDSAREPEDETEPVDFTSVFELLDKFDMKANITIAELLNAGLPIENLLLEASLENHVFYLSDTRGILAGSPVQLTAELDMRSDCATLAGDLNITNLDLTQISRFLGDEANLSGRLDVAEIGSRSCGDTLQQHLESLHLEANVTGFSAARNGEPLPLSFDSFTTEINWREAGRLSFEGYLLDERISATAGFGSVEAIRNRTQWPINIDANSDGTHVTVAGEAVVIDENVNLDIELGVDVHKFGSLHNWIGANPENDLGLKGETSLRLDENGLKLDNYKVTLGNSDARGGMTWAGPRSDLPVQLQLESENLDLSELSTLFPENPDLSKDSEPVGHELLTQSEWLEKWFALPAVDFKLSMKNIDGSNYQARNVDLFGSIRDRKVEDSHLSLQLGDIDIEGSLNASLQEHPWSVDFAWVLDNIDIGEVLTAFGLAENLDAYARKASVKFTSTGQTFRQLVENSSMVSTIEDFRWAFEFGPENQQHKLRLSELKLTVMPDSSSSWLASGIVNEVPLRAWMATPSLKDTFNPVNELPITLVLDIGQDVLKADVVVYNKTASGRRIDLSLSGEKAVSEDQDLSQLRMPLKDFYIQTDLRLKKDEVLFRDIDAKTGSSSAAGTIGIRYSEPIYIFDVDIKAPYVETDDLAQWAQDWRTELRGPLTDQEHIEKSDQGILTVANKWIQEIIRSNQFNVTVNIDELRSAGTLLGKAELGLKMNEQEMVVASLRISSEAGNAEAIYHGRQVGAGIDYELEIDVERLEYGGLLRLLDPDAETAGKVFLKSSLESRSPDVQQSVAHLQGTLDLAVFPEGARAEFLDIWASNLIFALLPSTEDSGKVMNCLVARFNVENGVLKSKNTFLDSTDIIVRARGEIDLANQKIDLWAAPQSKREKFLSISAPIAINGPFSDFKVGLAPGGFLTSMIRMYYGLIYVPWKWLTGERFPPDGIETCYKAMDWESP